MVKNLSELNTNNLKLDRRTAKEIAELRGEGVFKKESLRKKLLDFIRCSSADSNRWPAT